MAYRNNAVNFNRLAKYNFNYLSLEETLVLEYLIFNHLRKTKFLITHSVAEAEMGMKRTRQIAALDKLEEKEIIKSEFDGFRKVYALNTTLLIHLLDKIYVKPNRYLYEFFNYVRNPEKKSLATTAKATPAKGKAGKSKTKKELNLDNQISLF